MKLVSLALPKFNELPRRGKIALWMSLNASGWEASVGGWMNGSLIERVLE